MNPLLTPIERFLETLTDVPKVWPELDALLTAIADVKHQETQQAPSIVDKPATSP